MVEITVLLALLGAALVAVALFAAVWFVLKLAFKIVLFPITLLFGALKIGFALVIALVTLAVAPVLFVVLAVLAIPLLLIAALVGFGFFVFALAT